MLSPDDKNFSVESDWQFDTQDMRGAWRRLTAFVLASLLLINPCAAATNKSFARSLRDANARKSASHAPQKFQLNASDEAFLEDLSHRAFLFFREQTNLKTGLTLDRARADGSPYSADSSNYNVASIASTGFGLTALCIAAERGWTTRDDARGRVRTTLDFFAHRASNEHGWFYHFVDATTGVRRWRSEISSIDTALLLAGILTAKSYFRDDAEIKNLADLIYRRVDFQWMLNGSPTLLSHGYKPESGFLKSRWDTYSEHTILQFLAIGSPTHPIPPASWRAWSRTHYTYEGETFITPALSPSGGDPLFVHQYAQAWVDFRGRRETWYPYTNYFENSITATRAHKSFCLNLAREFPESYSENIWGITASDGAKGYFAWGGPPRDPAIDGTLVPCAAGGSLMFTPNITLPVLQTMREKFGDKIYTRYGFVDAFNPTSGWIDTDVIGIDVGITLLSAENLRTGNVWRWFMRNEEIKRAMNAVGLKRNHILH